LSTWQGTTPEQLAEIQARIKASIAPRQVRRSDLDKSPHKLRDSLPKSKARARQRSHKKATPEPSEHQIQCSVIDWWSRWARTKGFDVRLLAAMPNAGAGGQRGQAGKMKAEGQRPGYPDLLLDLPAPGFHGLRIEVKKPSGRVAQHQAEYHELLRRQDYCVLTCYGFQETTRAIMFYCESALNRLTNSLQDAREPR
jgi:hypothetical protein